MLMNLKIMIFLNIYKCSIQGIGVFTEQIYVPLKGRAEQTLNKPKHLTQNLVQIFELILFCQINIKYFLNLLLT